MKKILSIIVLFIMCTFCFVANAEHTTFKGISLGENITTFTSSLKSKGCTFVEKVANPSYDIYEFKGDFAGKTNCEIMVFTSKDGNAIGKVIVYLPKIYNWYDIKSEYNKFVESFTQKYGKPDSDYHFFSSPYYEGDGYEMTAVALGKCNYAAFWNEIMISISKFKQIEILYEDTENMNIIINNGKAKIQEDI